MVWCVCADHDVKHRRMSTQLSSRGMAITRLSSWTLDFWSRLDYVFFLVLLLVCHPVTSITPNTTTDYPAISAYALSSATNLTTVTGGATDNITSAHSPITESPSNSSTVPLTTSPFTVLNTTKTMTDTTATSSNMSTTIPAMTLTTELHSTDNQTTETTPYTSIGNTTFSETTTISASTENTTFSETTTNSTSTENTTFFETTTISASTVNTTFSETTTNSTSTENTTFFETTTISASTVNTTFSETTTNSTSTENTTTTNSTFTATPEPSSSANTTDTTPLLTTINQTFTTNDTAPTHCQSCTNVFYWMTTSVEVMGTPQSEQNVTTQLEELFRRELDACATPVTRSIRGSISESSVTEKLSLFEAMELTCDQKNITKNAQCYILLKLTAHLNICCIINTVMEMNSSIRVSVVGQIERVGVCADDITQISAGQYDKCNQSFDHGVICSAEQPQNITCGNSTNVIFPLNIDAPEVCPTSPPTPTCYCSSHCNSSDYYYYTNISLIGVTSNITSQILDFLKYPACQNMSSVCNISQTFISHIQDSRMICEYDVIERRICKVIVKLDTAMDVCDIRTALEAILKPQNDSVIFDGVVSRVAICYNTSSDPLRQTLIWQPSLSTNFSSEVFCMESNRENFNEYCSVGNTVIPLNDSCNLSTTPVQNITTTLPSFTSTSLSNITINSTAILVSTSVNVTTLPANVTTSVSSTTSGTLDADELLKLSANASSLNATQVDKLLSQLESLLSGPNVSLAVANTSVNIVNNLLDVPVAVITPFSNRAIKVVDTVGLKLVVSETSQSVLSQSLALAVKKVDGANFQETSFSLVESSNLQIRSNPGKTEALSRDIAVRVGSTPLGSVTLPASLTQNLTDEQQQLASRVQFNFFQKSTFFQDKSLGSRKLNSGILGSSVANLSISGLQKEVLITLRNTEPIPANYVASCVFWDFSFNGGSGGWNAAGCRVLNSSAEETQCACNHLTSFGILLDISRTPIPEEHLNILTYITYIGCGISAIFLSITLLTYLAFGKLRKDIPSKILIQLCLALLLLNLVFLLDAWLALYPDAVGLCISTAFFLHYFLLASFTWMALEAVHMYLAIVKVFNTYISRFMVKIGFAGWGIPLIVVIIVIAINKDNYGLVTYGRYADGGTNDFCWIKNDIAFYVAVVAYFCLVFLLNFAMFIVVMIQLCRIKKQNPHNAQNRSGWHEVRSVAGLTMLLGLTWGFAFFAWGPVNLAFMYLFAIFNTLQGFFIFVFHCAMKENVRRQWRTYLCCGRLRLSENSEWSRTATQKINKASKEKTSSFHSSNSNNSSLSFLNHDRLAETQRGIGNPMDDRIITAAEEPVSGSDVVMNEINDQYWGQRSY
ncbi:adhesion G-protein coupled receptor G2 [Ctenopharyngodon idella]|uniref:adhesion G-protein coupled receptor G2 n=1 Tax=Ctenopharyngodon idella TaxID=7959 RepID=UPI0022327739|nr:adhesion G-protein coupled receptor G2 [Ctenopharyngodon idella]XP_051767348.1 adhesion G-protein coupled receptor G2 [Ctenopharyngodon idella]XP_051767349.1 adhesion G-protein coupled receptor G2 [Ctenopharyngodon idella]XP_051767350.1 adhesion G-protein coupled receptor G2 [Ctenopharyngodon idella]